MTMLVAIGYVLKAALNTFVEDFIWGYLHSTFNLKEFPVCLQRGFPYSP